MTQSPNYIFLSIFISFLVYQIQAIKYQISQEYIINSLNEQHKITQKYFLIQDTGQLHNEYKDQRFPLTVNDLCYQFYDNPHMQKLYDRFVDKDVDNNYRVKQLQPWQQHYQNILFFYKLAVAACYICYILAFGSQNYELFAHDGASFNKYFSQNYGSTKSKILIGAIVVLQGVILTKENNFKEELKNRKLHLVEDFSLDIIKVISIGLIMILFIFVYAEDQQKSADNLVSLILMVIAFSFVTFRKITKYYFFWIFIGQNCTTILKFLRKKENAQHLNSIGFHFK